MEPLQAADPRTIGPYRVLSRIGTGGMGVVFLVVDESGSRFALKLLRPEFVDNAGFRLRFRREVEAAQRVGGVYNARYLDADLDSSHPYLVTEYVEGGSLLDFVTEHGPLEGDQLIGLAVGLAEALVAMNAAGVFTEISSRRTCSWLPTDQRSSTSVSHSPPMARTSRKREVSSVHRDGWRQSRPSEGRRLRPSTCSLGERRSHSRPRVGRHSATVGRSRALPCRPRAT